MAKPLRHVAQQGGGQTPRAPDHRALGIGRREQQADRQRRRDARHHRQQAIGAEQQDAIRMGGIEQGHHGGRIAGEQGPVGDESALDVAEQRAGADPERQAEHQKRGLGPGCRHDQHPDPGPEQGSRRPEEALLDQHVPCRLGGREHGHRRPLRMFEPESPGEEQRKTGGKRGPEAVTQALRIEAEPGEIAGEVHRASCRMPDRSGPERPAGPGRG